jgi:periplasmic divalent cation tolerance protein
MPPSSPPSRRKSAEPIVVLTTAGGEEQAVEIAEHLVGQRLAACVNIHAQVRSIYRWQERIWDDEEFLLMIKTTRRAFPAVAEAIRARHSYELPEILALPVVAGDARVLSWIQASVSDKGGSPSGRKARPRRQRAGASRARP